MSGAGYACSINQPFYTNCNLYTELLTKVLLRPDNQQLGFYLMSVEGQPKGMWANIGGSDFSYMPSFSEYDKKVMYEGLLREVCYSAPLEIRTAGHTLQASTPVGSVEFNC